MSRFRHHRAIVLLSGGMDSATVLAIASQKYRVHALTVLYGQRHPREVQSARRLGRYYSVDRHTILSLPLTSILRSALTSPRRRLPQHPYRGRIPSTYVPARNTILLSLALGLAESEGASFILIGANAVDYSGYPDCRPAYFRAFQHLCQLATKMGVERKGSLRIIVPLLHRSKADIVRWGNRLGVPWKLTWSCYQGGRYPCGTCASCRLRAKGFREAGTQDPLLRQTPSR